MIRKARVIAVHASRRRVDLAFLDNNEIVAECEVLSADASTDSGTWNVPDVPRPKSNATAGGIDGGGRNLIAACIMAYGRPVVLGFLHHTGGDIAFSQANRSVTRHPSGSYTTTAPDGSMELYHASGAYIRIGTGGHEDLAPLAADKNWRAPSGAAPATITVATGGVTVMIDPSGTVTIAALHVNITSTDINLGGAGGKKVALDGDPVVNNKVVASSTTTKAA